MAFWGVEVKPGRPFTYRVSDARGRLHISQATLGSGNSTDKSIVQCNVGDRSPVFLCSLRPDKFESCQLNLEFEEDAEVEFSVVGPRSIHLTGYYITGNRNITVNDDKSETYGEDIADTERGESSSWNEYDYSDSFINDGDPNADRDSPASDSDYALTIRERLDKMKAKKRNGNRRRLVKKYQAIDSDANDNWKLGVFSDANDSSAGDSLEVPDSEDENEVHKFACSRGEMSKAKGKSILEMVEKILKSKKTLGENEREIKPLGDILVSMDQRSIETLLKKKEKKEKKERLEDPLEVVSTVECNKGQQNLFEVAQKEKHAIDKGIKSSGDSLPSSDQKSCKRKKEGHEDSVKAISVVERVKGQQIPFEGTSNEKQAFDKSTSDILPSLESAGCENLLKKRKTNVQDGTVEANPSVEGAKGQLSLIEGTSNEKQTIDKKIKKEVDDHPQFNENTSKKCLEAQDEGGNKSDDRPPLGKENIKLELGDDEHGALVNNKSLELEASSNGLIIEELEKGKQNGKLAIRGKKVSIFYTAKLKENGQVFDSNVGKTPLRFRIGGGKVIEGLSIGVEGMRVGEKRRITIPPSLGYAREGTSYNAPRTAWLVCEVEAVKVR